MKVTILFPRALDEPQGLSNVVKQIALNLTSFASKGVELKVISRDSIVNKHITYNNGCSSIYPPFISKLRGVLIKRLVKSAKKSNFCAKKLISKSHIYWSRQVVRYYLNNEDDSDIIMFHDFFTCYEYMNQVKNNQKLIVCMIHSIGIPLYGLKIDYPKLVGSRFFKQLEYMDNYVMNHVDKYGFVSKKSVANFKGYYPDYNDDKLFYIHNGISPQKLKNSIKEKTNNIEVCCVASVNNSKGQPRIVDAIITLTKKLQYPKNIHFTCIGDGDVRHTLQEDVDKLQLNEYITFIGQVSNVEDYLCKSDIFILPTSNDGLPISIIEAMRAQLPIVSTRIGGIEELVEENINGVFIEPSTEGVISFIERINDFDWKSMGAKSRIKFEMEFSIDIMIDKYIQLFNSLKIINYDPSKKL